MKIAEQAGKRAQISMMVLGVGSFEYADKQLEAGWYTVQRAAERGAFLSPQQVYWCKGWRAYS